MVAVTGTNGKTSSVDFLRQFWTLSGLQAASLGTLGVIAPGHAGGGGLTTPDPVALAETMATLAHEGVTHAALEASSHGLDQYRLDGVAIAAAGFTNLTRDHLDYHGTMSAYRTAIVSDLAALHGGALKLEDSPLGGLRARLRLPATRSMPTRSPPSTTSPPVAA